MAKEPPNQTLQRMKGLSSLKRRMKEGDIIIMSTDKSSKLAITDVETYLKLGEKHIMKDKEITLKEVAEMEKDVNGHTAMFIKMTGMGNEWNQGDRMRTSTITRSKTLASLFLQLKDHKKTLDTRAVVSACDSYTVGLSNILSDFIESVANAVNEPCEVISSEDMLSRIHRCNKDLETLRKQRLENGETLSEDEEKIFIIGADVIALFPSMTSVRTARIARDEVTKSPIECDGMNYKEMSRYICIMEKMTSGVEKVRRVLPRRSKDGAKPTDIGIRNREINSKHVDTEIEWTFPAVEPTNLEKREMRGIMCEIGVRVLWENFSYRFGRKIYHQQSGGPIGARITMACSRLVMQQWGESYTKILLKSNIRLRLFGNYVDDIRQGTNLIPKGYKFIKLGDVIEFRQEWKEQDEMENLSDLKRMGNVCREIMNGINPDLQFTVESEEDFPNKRLQTLDFETWTQPDGTISHSFFEKSMQTPYVTMERSAMSSQQKHAILANDLIRRLSMVDQKVDMEEKLEVVNKFTRKLKTSGYNHNQCMELVTSGVRGFLNKLKNREKNGEEMYRSARSTLGKRIHKKLTEKNNLV